ncbi:MAG TPA: hypothetical protein GX518_03870 [Firmicutes bacterium]|nr:hypothetical protein [Bacillota bacterium]
MTAVTSALPGLVVEEPVLFFSRGCARVVGEVRNEGKGAVALIRVEAVFRNQRGEVAGWEYTYINHLNPGERKPYCLFLPEEEAVERVEVAIASASPAREQAVALVGRDLKVFRGQGGFLSIGGKVINTGAKAYDLVKVILKFTGEEGEIVDMASHYLSDLGPGEERAFACRWEEREGWTGIEVLFD